MANAAGVEAPNGRARGVAWGDYDGDGHLDLYVANDAHAASRLYKGNGNTFTELASGAGAPVCDGTKGRGVAWGDYDGDGHLDLFVATYSSSQNNLYKQMADDSLNFDEVSSAAGVQGTTANLGVCWADFNGDASHCSTVFQGSFCAAPWHSTAGRISALHCIAGCSFARGVLCVSV